MKFGLKLWSSNTDLIEQAIQLIDEKTFYYIELFIIPDTQISPFMIEVPYIIHIPHHKFGVNIGEASKKEYNIQKINESIAWADKLNAEYLILHAGHGSMKDAEDLLRKVADSRLLIENMPKVGLEGEMMIGYSPEQTLELMQVNDFGLCLDFGHAIKAAVSLGFDHRKLLKKFMGFNPKLFHLSDGMLDREKDEHLNIGEGEYDLRYLLNSIEKNKSRMVTLETPRMNQRSLQEDIQNLNFLRKNLLDFF